MPLCRLTHAVSIYATHAKALERIPFFLGFQQLGDDINAMAVGELDQGVNEELVILSFYLNIAGDARLEYQTMNEGIKFKAVIQKAVLNVSFWRT